MPTNGFVPPPYPYERVDRFKPLAAEFDGGLVDFSIGTPFDPPPGAVIEMLGSSGLERSYPLWIVRQKLTRPVALQALAEVSPVLLDDCGDANDGADGLSSRRSYRL